MTKPSAGNTGRHDLAGSADYFPGKNCCQRCGLWVSDIGKHINEKYCAGLGVAAPKEDSILWDRLRADLNSLGAVEVLQPSEVLQQSAMGVIVAESGSSFGRAAWDIDPPENLLTARYRQRGL